MFYGNASGYKGVEYMPPKPGRRRVAKYRGVIMLGKKKLVSPYHLTPEPAARWYDAMARENFGEFARVNFPAQS
jgi:hypothetical protein